MAAEQYDDYESENDVETATITEQPPENSFWQQYNSNLECPISWLMSVLAHVVIMAVLAGLLLYAMRGKDDTSPVPISLAVGTGDDAAGEGMKNAIGVPEPIAPGDSTPKLSDFEALPLPDAKDLPNAMEDVRKELRESNDLADIPLTDEKIAPLTALGKDLRDKMNQAGQQRGTLDGTKKGPLGTGADSTNARSMRWVIRFQVFSGRDYLTQLASFGAIVIVPIPPENKSAYVFRDLLKPRPGEVVAEAEWTKLAQQMRFCDFRPESVQQVTSELGVGDLRANMFWAFFPKSVEQKMADLERAYQNRSPESVSETVFEVIQVAGKYDFRVVRQIAK